MTLWCDKPQAYEINTITEEHWFLFVEVICRGQEWDQSGRYWRYSEPANTNISWVPQISPAVVAVGSVNNESVKDSISPHLIFCSHPCMEERAGEWKEFWVFCGLSWDTNRSCLCIFPPSLYYSPPHFKPFILDFKSSCTKRQRIFLSV